MIDFSPVKAKDMTFAQFQERFSAETLATETNAMIDHMLALITDCIDADVVFQPTDPEANDRFADDEADANLAWNLGHLIVHATASSEESAALACELARGVEYHGRSRYETPWQEITTLAQCVQRLEESRRMRLASLQMWPDEPKFDNTYVPWESLGPVDARGRFLMGLWHDDGHLAQIADVVKQATAARQAV